MRVALVLALSLLLPHCLAAYEDYGFSRACTVTAQAGPIRVKVCDLYFEKQADGVFLMWDATSYQDLLAPYGPDSLSKSAQALVEGPGRADYPKAKRFKVAVIKVTDRDTYGMPRWDTIKFLLRLSYALDKKGRAVPVPEPK